MSGGFHTRENGGETLSAVENMILDRIALILVIVGALNWGSVGLFQFDLVSWAFGGQDALVSRIVYTLVALAGIWCISLLFRSREALEE
jgi:uncharacterized membrane protein YuzA (DUF378 family)